MNQNKKYITIKVEINSPNNAEDIKQNITDSVEEYFVPENLEVMGEDNKDFSINNLNSKQFLK